MAGSNSFVENINTVANATTLATGDVIEDAQLARDAAENSATNALISEANANVSEVTAEAWATKAFNSEVETGKYSAYHWSVIAAENAGSTVISDLITSASTTWSSNKLTIALSEKSSSSHTHTNTYEPTIAKATAFNKDFADSSADSGVADTVARGDHNHASVYEPIIPSKGTAFNKDIGTVSGTLAEGDHTHNYMPLVTAGSAYNKNFVANTTAPLADEVPRGNHTHTSSGISYDNTENSIVTSSTAQGAISQLDGVVSTFSSAERANLSAYLTTSPSTVIIATAEVPVKVTAGMTTLAGHTNAVESGGNITIDYPTTPDNLIEGWFSTTVSINREANTVYQIGLYKNDIILGTGFIAEIGTTSASAGPNQVSLDAFITGMENGDTLSVYVSNETNTNNVTINSFTVSFAGAPEGAMIVTGVSVAHSDLTGTGAASGVHTIADIAGDTTTLQAELDLRANKVVPAAVGNLPMLSVTGDLVDSTIASTAITDKMNFVSSPTLDNIVTMTSGGDSKDSGTLVSDLALVGGDSTQLFEVATATGDTHAITKATFDSTVTGLASNYAPKTHSDTISGNPHSVTYTEVGAAAVDHTHAQSEVTGLADSLALKYDEITAVQNNLVAFDTAGVLKDSGISYTDITTNTAKTGVTNEIPSDTTETGTNQVLNIVYLTQAAYDLLTPVATTIYVIQG